MLCWSCPVSLRWALMPSASISQHGSLSLSHENSKCIVSSVLPHRAQLGSAGGSSRSPVERLCLKLVQTCRFITKKLFSKVFDGIPSLKRLSYPVIKLARLGTGIPSFL